MSPYSIWIGLGTTNAPSNDFSGISMNGGVEYHLPRFPRPIIGASYLMHDHSPLLCGGENDRRDILRTCYYLN